MAEFYLPVLDQLRSELSYLSEKRRRDITARLEDLLAEIQPDHKYTYEAIHERITLYPPEENRKLPMLGAELLHDLHYMLKHISGTFDVAAADLEEPVYRLDQVADMFDIPPAKVLDWCHHGLIVKRYIFCEEKEAGVCESELDRFMHLRAEAGGRTTRLRLPDKTTRHRLCLQAEKLTAGRSIPLCTLVEILSSKHHIPNKAVLLTLRERDKANPTDMLFPNLVSPLTREQKWEIHEARLAGSSLENLMEHFDRSRVEILRVIRQVKLCQILDTVDGYMDNALFEHPNADEIILGTDTSRAAAIPLPDFVEQMGPNELLTKEQEADLFRRYNYLKFRVAEYYDSLAPSLVTAAIVERARRLRDAAIATRNVIIERNTGLVIRVAHRHADAKYQNISELISDGTITLMKAVEKFDFARGVRFSTYATWALMKNYAKTVPESNYHLEREGTGQEELLDTLTSLTGEEEREQKEAMERQAAILRALDRLSDREQDIIKSHFGLDDDQPATLAQIGERMEITRERVRQIERRALDKIRDMFS